MGLKYHFDEDYLYNDICTSRMPLHELTKFNQDVLKQIVYDELKGFGILKTLRDDNGLVIINTEPLEDDFPF